MKGLKTERGPSAMHVSFPTRRARVDWGRQLVHLALEGNVMIVTPESARILECLLGKARQGMRLKTWTNR